MFCPNCGTQCDDSASFCQECGTKINQSQPVENVTAPSTNFDTNPMGQLEPRANPNPNPGYNPYYGNAPVEPQRNSTAVLVLGIIAVVNNLLFGCFCACAGCLPGLVCAIIGLVMGFKNKKTYAPGEKDQKNDIGVILCFVSLGVMVVMTILGAIIGAATYSEMLYY